MCKERKVLSLVLLLAMLISMVAACAPAQTGAQQPAVVEGAKTGKVVKITYWHGWTVEHEKKAMEDAVKLFNDSHPNIQVEPVSGKTNDQVLTAVSGGNPPDVWSLWSTQTLAEWASKGVISDLTNKVQAAKVDPSIFYQVALDVSKYQGKYYGLPIEVDPLVVYYNKDLFKEAGLDPEKPPATMEELYAYAEKLTKVDANGNITQLGFMGNNFNEAYLFGGEWWEPKSGQPTANNPGNIASWNLSAGYYKKFGGEKINTFNTQQADNPLGSLFVAGKVGMAIDGDWVVNFMTRFAPKTNFGMFPMPPAKGHEDRAKSTYLDGSVYVIPSNAPHPEEAWEFVRWMSTSPEAECILQKGWSNTSVLKSVVKDPKCAPHERWSTFVDMMDNGKHFVWPPIAVSAMYFTEMGTAYDNSVKFGKTTPEAALNELQLKISDELKKTQ